MEKKKKKKLIITLMLGAALLLAQIMIVACIINLISNGLVWSDRTFAKVFVMPSYWVTNVVIWIGVAVWIFYVITGDRRKEVLKYNEGENSHLLTVSEMKKSKSFIATKFNRLEECSDGVVLRAEKIRNNIQIVMSKKPTHTISIGSTGMGKTTGYLIPNIQVLAHTKTKPSFVITDPKGEIFDINSSALKALGYNIEVVDLKKPYESTKWNPFGRLIELIDMIVELRFSEETIDIADAQNTRNTQNADNAKNAENTKKDTYMWRGKMLTEIQKEQKIQELRDEVYENCRDIVSTICPIERSNDPKWQEGARDLINAIALAFCEDYEEGLIKKEQFCLASLYSTVVDYASGECEALRKYLIEERSERSKVKGLAKSVLEGTAGTLSSYLTSVNDDVAWLSDTAILSLTSESELDIKNFDDVPTVLFIKFPDEKPTRYKLVSLLIGQLYKGFVEKAAENKESEITEEAELKRNVYFFLDEFGNLPKISNLNNVITVARSRKIFFQIIVQSFAQLEDIYGKNVAEIVKSNCNIKICLGSDNKQTMEEISFLCGKKKVTSVNISERNEKKDTFNSQNSVKEVPLVYPIELSKLNNEDNFGNAVITMLGQSAFRTKYTPSFMAKEIYKIGEKEENENVDEVKIFTESEHVYNIASKATAKAQLEEMQQQMIREMEIEDTFLSEQEYLQKQRNKMIDIDLRVRGKLAANARFFEKATLEKMYMSSLGEKLSMINKIIDGVDMKERDTIVKLIEVKVFIASSIKQINEIEEIAHGEAILEAAHKKEEKQIKQEEEEKNEKKAIKNS